MPHPDLKDIVTITLKNQITAMADSITKDNPAYRRLKLGQLPRKKLIESITCLTIDKEPPWPL